MLRTAHILGRSFDAATRGQHVVVVTRTPAEMFRQAMNLGLLGASWRPQERKVLVGDGSVTFQPPSAFKTPSATIFH